MLGIQAAFVGIVASRTEIASVGCAGPIVTFGVVADRQWVRVTVHSDAKERFASSLQLGDYVYIEGALFLHVFDEPQGPMKMKRVLNISAQRCERLCNNIGRNVAAPWLDPHAPPLDLVAEASPPGETQTLPAPDDTNTPSPYRGQA